MRTACNTWTQTLCTHVQWDSKQYSGISNSFFLNKNWRIHSKVVFSQAQIFNFLSSFLPGMGYCHSTLHSTVHFTISCPSTRIPADHYIHIEKGLNPDLVMLWSAFTHHQLYHVQRSVSSYHKSIFNGIKLMLKLWLSAFPSLFAPYTFHIVSNKLHIYPLLFTMPLIVAMESTECCPTLNLWWTCQWPDWD